MSDAKTINEMTYGEFDRQYSDKETKPYLCPFYFSSNEDKFSDVVDALSQERLSDVVGEIGDERRCASVHFMGVVGGVDMAWNYIAALQPERSFLFDISTKPILYHGLRMDALRGAKRLEDYYGNLLCMTDEEKKYLGTVKGSDKLWEIISDYEPDMVRFAESCRQTARNLGYDEITDAVSEVLLDMTFRKKSVHRSISYANMLIGQRKVMQSWMVGPNFRRLVEQAEAGQVKASRKDLFNSFSGFADNMVDTYGIKNLVIYLSNVPEMLGNIKRKGASKVISDSRPINERLQTVIEIFENKLDRLWLIDSRLNKNRIIARGGSKYDPQQ